MHVTVRSFLGVMR